jgi:hypothetical protein
MTERREGAGMSEESARRPVWGSPERVEALREHYDTTDQSLMVERAVLETDVVADPMVTTSLRLPKSLLDWVRVQAEQQDLKPTALIRRWVEERRRAVEGHGGMEERLARVERRLDDLTAASPADG